MVPLLSEIKGPADQEITASGQNDLSLTVLKWGAHPPPPDHTECKRGSWEAEEARGSLGLK